MRDLAIDGGERSETVPRPFGFGARRFRDRAEAGSALRAAIRDDAPSLDLILAIPRGGLPVAEVVAEGLSLPLDVLIARKVETPGQAELAMGAVTRFGAVWNASVLASFRLPEGEIEACRQRALAEVERREAAYRGVSEALAVEGQRVLLIDDGLATGATMAAAVEGLFGAGAPSVAVGVPVASPDAVARIESMGATVVAVVVRRNFYGVGQFYEDFGQVPDADCIEILRRAGRRGSQSTHARGAL